MDSLTCGCVIDCNGLPVVVLSRLEVVTEEQQKVLKVLWHRKIFSVIKPKQVFNFEY